MAIVKETIKAEILSLINATSSLDVEQAKTEFADKLADVVVNALKSSLVTINAGIPVSTSSGAGATTGPGTGSLS